MKYRTKKQISYIVSAIVIIGAAGWICSRLFHLRQGEFTDNAEVKMQIVPVNSRVQGFIKEIRFSEYQPISKGDTLVIIDDSDLKLNLARANADLQNALAGHSVANQSVSSASANVAVSDASISEAKILMEQSLTDFKRYENLLEQGAVTRREYDAAKTDYEAKRARYQTLARQKSATSSVVDVNRSRISQSEAGIELAKAMVETAQLNLSYTVILAPCSGYCSRKEIQEGQLIQPGQLLLSIIDSGDVWVAANYKETQLKNISVGAPVEIEVDAIPGVNFSGRVEAISSATGGALSPLPHDNSSGNFVKVRQRIPVRIRFSESNRPEEMAKLRAGMNVECIIK